MMKPGGTAQEKPIRVGVIGCGQFMGRQHAAQRRCHGRSPRHGLRQSSQTLDQNRTTHST